MARFTKWTQPAEVLATVGVIITLLFLIVEVRENTAAVRTESYGQSIDRLNDWRLALAADEKLTDIFVRFLADGTVDFNETETQQFNFIYGSLWSIYEAAYYAQQYDTMGAEEWSRHQSMLCNQHQISSEHGWWHSGTTRQFTPEFLSWVKETCDDA